jgi:hypothetical protein
VELSLADELALVAYDPGKRRLSGGSDPRLNYSLAGAVVVELVLRGAATLDGGGLEALDDTGDNLLDSALARIRSSRRRRDLKHWVRALPNRSFRMRERLLQRLVDAGILEPRSERVLGLFSVWRYRLVGEGRRNELLGAVGRALRADSAPDDRMAALIGLLSTAGLVDRVVAKGERAAARSRAKAIGRNQAGSKVVSSAVADAQAAVMAGVTAAVVSAATVDGSAAHGH